MVLTSITSDAIEARARQLGADIVGIVRSEPLVHEAEDLERWLQLGYHGAMSWMARNPDIRNDPSKLLPGCRSIVMIAVNYYTPHHHLRFPNFPRISRYAWGRDYHHLLGDLLKKLRDEMDDVARETGIYGARYRVAVDTSPFRDKVWAQRAGIGWIGKNSLLLTRQFGSWVFLGALLTTLELDATSTEPHPNHCGNCHACLDACPTGAIVRPGQIDARACLSYLTIEYGGKIQSRYQDRFEGWIFGCDTCQDVCPWNARFARPARIPHFSPRDGLLVPDLQLFGHMTAKEYDMLTKDTPLRRAGRDRLRRNALAVMGLL